MFALFSAFAVTFSTCPFTFFTTRVLVVVDQLDIFCLDKLVKARTTTYNPLVTFGQRTVVLEHNTTISTRGLYAMEIAAGRSMHRRVEGFISVRLV